MTYSEFADKMLIALYQESENDMLKPEGITFGFLTDKYGLPRNDRWLGRLAKEWENEGLADVSDLLAPAADLEVEIGGRGMRRIEQLYGSKDGVGTILEPVQNERADLAETLSEITGSRIFISKDGVLPENPKEGDLVFALSGSANETGIDSSGWTGLPKQGVLTRDAVERVSFALKDANNLIEHSGASNSEKAQARAYVLAIKALAESPEPPADLIWQLIHRANSIAGIASLFVALVALFTHA